MLHFLLSLAQEKFPTVNDSTVKARVILQNLKTLSYNFSPSDLQLAADFTQTLEELYHMFYSKLPNESGILIRPPDQKSLRSTRRREHTAHDANDYASLPPHKKVKKSSHRVGIKADRKRKQSEIQRCVCIKMVLSFPVSRVITISYNCKQQCTKQPLLQEKPPTTTGTYVSQSHYIAISKYITVFVLQ